MSRSSNIILAIQGMYISITSIWPLIHLHSFLQITGSTSDIHLLKTMSLLLLCIGISFISQSAQRGSSAGIRMLAFNVAIALTIVDFYYTTTRVISEVYVIDGFIQLLFVSLWLFKTISRSRFPVND
jgi:hypothetical protein